MKSDIELAVEWSKRLEGLLTAKLGATGRGLHEKVSSVERRLPQTTVKKLRFIATIRNKVVHEPEYAKMQDRAGFERSCAALATELEATRPVTQNQPTESPTPRDKPGINLELLTLAFAILGAGIGFGIPTVLHMAFSISLLGAVVGALAGFYWKYSAAILLFALVAGGVYWVVKFT